MLLDGRPERLILERPDEGGARRWLPHDRLVARVRTVSRGLGMAFLSAGEGVPELTAPSANLTEGALVSATVVAPARRGKLAVARVLAPAEAETMGALAPQRSMRDRLQGIAPGAALETGPAARDAADAAEAEALQNEHPLPAGARLSIEATRALIAVDVDVAASAAGGDVRRRQRTANLAALAALPRLLRLKGLGGLIAIDLVGKRHNGSALAAAALGAFRPVYGDDVALGPISRFGLLQLQIPWLDTPVAELLLGGDGEPAPLTRAFRLLREIEREAGAGGRVSAGCAPAVYAAAEPHIATLKAAIGDRFTLTAEPGFPPQTTRVSPQ